MKQTNDGVQNKTKTWVVIGKGVGETVMNTITIVTSQQPGFGSAATESTKAAIDSASSSSPILAAALFSERQ